MSLQRKLQDRKAILAKMPPELRKAQKSLITDPQSSYAEWFDGYRSYSADALNLIAQKIHKATTEISSALNQSADTVNKINSSVASTELALSMLKYDIGQRSPCFLRVAKRELPDKQRRLADDELPLHARIGDARSTASLMERLESKEENPFSLMYRDIQELQRAVKPIQRRERKPSDFGTAGRSGPHRSSLFEAGSSTNVLAQAQTGRSKVRVHKPVPHATSARFEPAINPD